MTHSHKLRFGIIGFGQFAERAVLPAMKAVRDIEVVALQKRTLQEAEAKARAHGVPLAFSSVEELVTHSDVDAVFIVSANAAHCPETIVAARAGKHVLVEKPMALTVREAEAMIGGVQERRGAFDGWSPRPVFTAHPANPGDCQVGDPRYHHVRQGGFCV